MTSVRVFWEWLRAHALDLPPLGKFALGMALIFGIPPLSRRIRLRGVVGLLLSGIIVGPHVLGMPQVATTLAVTLVAFNTFDSLHQRLIDLRMLHVVLVLMFITATLGPILTQYFVPRMRKDFSVKEARNA